MDDQRTVAHIAFSEQRHEILRRISAGQPPSDEDIFNICSSCENTALEIHKLSADLRFKDFEKCLNCRIYMLRPDMFD